MHDDRLKYLAREYREECYAQGRVLTFKRGDREITFEQFVADRDAAMDSMIYHLRRNPLSRIPEVDALPI